MVNAVADRVEDSLPTRVLSDHIQQSGKTRAIQMAATNSGDRDDPATILA
jgi:hypothetical protein